MGKKLDYFELNNKILEDFDNLMKLHLDEVKHLKINKNITNSKLYNIIGLCFNIDTLEIDSDIKLDTNKVFSSICKPELLKKLKLENIKLLPYKKLNKFNNIKIIEMKNIRFSKVKEFLLSLDLKKSLEEISMEDVDFENDNLGFFEEFTNLKKIKAVNMINCKLEHLKFLSQLKKIEQIKFKANRVKIQEVDNFIKGNYKKDIQLQLETRDNNIKIKNKEVNIKIDGENIEKLIKNVNFNKITNLEIIFNEQTNFEQFIKILKKVKKEISICITDISKLTVEQSEILKEELNIKNISLLNSEREVTKSYDITTFIKMRSEIQKFIDNIPENLNDEEKILWIYKMLLKNIKYDETFSIDETDELKKGLIKRCCISIGYVEILKNCLLSLKFDINVINGKLKKENTEWYWLQIQVNDKWYNVDIALDAKQKSKMKYCLISNEKISKTHIIEGNSMYCVANFDSKEISKFWKKENIDSKQKKTVIQNIIEKLKVLFIINKRLPEGKSKIIEEDIVEK